MTFESDLRGWADRTGQKMDQIVRQAVVLAAQGVILKSPVGNPDLWKVNDNYHTMKNLDDRVMYNLFVDEANATRGEGEKKLRKFGRVRLKEGLKLRYSGYVGGRFRANWQLGIGSPDTTTTEETDKGGGATLGRIEAGMSNQKAGDIFYVSNSLPYAQRIEYEGWSTQAPAGVVRVTFAELASQVEQFAKSIK